MPSLSPSVSLSEVAVAAPTPSPVQPAGPVGSDEPRRRTLLVVDDEEGPRQSLRVVFKNDYDLLIARDGQAAIEMARRQKVDVAILDIRMVGMSGIDLLQKLKGVDPNIEVVMLTAYETIETVRQALRLGAFDYLNKPFDIPTIRAVVANAMERRSLTSEVRDNAERLRVLQSELQNHRVEHEMVRTRGEIYASIIHDINGPLTVISGLIQGIDQRIGEAARLEQEDVEVIKDRLKRITRQVSLCIEISRRYLGTIRQNQPEAARVWVNQVLADLGDLLRVHPAVRGNQLVIVPLKEDLTAQINATELVQVLLNLTLNALQCTKQPHRVEVRGHVLKQPLKLEDFRASPDDVFLGEGFDNQAPLLALSVQDNGPGMMPEVLRQVFDTSFTTRSAQGTGLGLSIVKRLIRQAGGALHAHSRLSQGSVFTIYLGARIFPNGASPGA